MTSNTGRTTISGPSLGLCSMLFLIFLTLKLTHYIDWSWWWITAPLWMPWAFFIGLFMLSGILVAIIHASTKRR